MPGLADLTVAKLDELAEAHNVDDYPTDGKKADKVHALEVAGVTAPDESETVYRLRLRKPVDGESFSPAHFMADSQAVELTDDDPLFETTDRWTYLGLRELPFLEEVDG